MSNGMRYMGIDFGTKRVGVAFSDESGKMAFPHGVLSNNEKLLDTLEALIEEKGVSEVVIGESIGKDGTHNKLQAAVEDLIGAITLRTGIPVHREPEQYTTHEATRIQGKSAHTDASAAAIILNSFLARKR